jgi:hypothetical protein
LLGNSIEANYEWTPPWILIGVVHSTNFPMGNSPTVQTIKKNPKSYKKEYDIVISNQQRIYSM